LEHLLIGFQDLEIDLVTAEFDQGLFSLLDEMSASPLLSKVWGNGQGIEPTSVSIVARHNGADNAVILKSDEEEVVVDGDFFVDGQLRVVSGVGVTKDLLPELDGALGV